LHLYSFGFAIGAAQPATSSPTRTASDAAKLRAGPGWTIEPCCFPDRGGRSLLGPPV